MEENDCHIGNGFCRPAFGQIDKPLIGNGLIDCFFFAENGLLRNLFPIAGNFAPAESLRNPAITPENWLSLHWSVLWLFPWK